MRIRHRDIKPTNIGMLRDRISVHVFDLSQTYEDSSDSGSDGEVEEMTRRFAPPEVINWGYRSRLSDVFSMGAIFFEMLRSLRPKLPNPLHKKLQNFQYGQNSDLLQERLVELKVSLPSDLEPVWDLCRNMLSYEPRVLPTDRELSCHRVDEDPRTEFCREMYAVIFGERRQRFRHRVSQDNNFTLEEVIGISHAGADVSAQSRSQTQQIMVSRVRCFI
jgi:serine/threonine protein kinase